MNNFNNSGYCDLNITHTPSEKLLAKIIEYDYHTIALNYTINVLTDNANEFDCKPTSLTNVNSLNLYPNELTNSIAMIASKYPNKLKVFTRITIIYNQPEQLKLILNHQDIKKYDIIAVAPAIVEAYQFACTHPLVDIISYIKGCNFKPKGKLHRQMVERNAYFEIVYKYALKKSEERQEVFTMAQYLSIYGKSKNLLISSGSDNCFDLRNPYDVSNLGILFCLPEGQAKCALSSSCRLLLLAAGRRFGKTAITVQVRSTEKEEPPAKKSKHSREVKVDNGL